MVEIVSQCFHKPKMTYLDVFSTTQIYSVEQINQ